MNLKFNVYIGDECVSLLTYIKLCVIQTMKKFHSKVFSCLFDLVIVVVVFLPRPMEGMG